MTPPKRTGRGTVTGAVGVGSTGRDGGVGKEKAAMCQRGWDCVLCNVFGFRTACVADVGPKVN